MTPERFALLRELALKTKFDWTYDDTVYVREPVEFIPRWPKDSVVVDFMQIKKVAFTLRKGPIAFFDRCGYPLTPTFMISWVEAEGHVITAVAFDEEGDQVAEDMVGMASPAIMVRKKVDG